MRFSEIDPTYVEEAFDTTAHIDWITKNDTKWAGFFTMGDQKFAIYYDKHRHADAWELSYAFLQQPKDPNLTGERKKFSPTGSAGKNTFRILSTVIASIYEFIHQEQPSRIEFTGDKSFGLKDLYSSIGSRIGNRLKAIGYEFSQTKAGSLFAIVKSASSMTEAFDSSAEIQWSKRNINQWTGVFAVGGRTFAVFFENFGRGWVVSYGVSNKRVSADDAEPDTTYFSPTGEGGASSIQVLSTVISAVTYFLQEKRPDSLKFTGDKTTNLSSLYTRMSRHLQGSLDSLGYTMQQDDSHSGARTFVLVRKDTIEEYFDLTETSTAGGTASGNVATAVGGLGAGFDPNGDHGIYQKVRKKTKKPIVIRR